MFTHDCLVVYKTTRVHSDVLKRNNIENAALQRLHGLYRPGADKTTQCLPTVSVYKSYVLSTFFAASIFAYPDIGQMWLDADLPFEERITLW